MLSALHVINNNDSNFGGMAFSAAQTMINHELGQAQTPAMTEMKTQFIEVIDEYADLIGIPKGKGPNIGIDKRVTFKSILTAKINKANNWILSEAVKLDKDTIYTFRDIVVEQLITAKRMLEPKIKEKELLVS